MPIRPAFVAEHIYMHTHTGNNGIHSNGTKQILHVVTTALATFITFDSAASSRCMMCVRVCVCVNRNTLGWNASRMILESFVHKDPGSYYILSPRYRSFRFQCLRHIASIMSTKVFGNHLFHKMGAGARSTRRAPFSIRWKRSLFCLSFKYGEIGRIDSAGKLSRALKT